VRHELSGYQVPLAQSQKPPPPEMRAVVSHVVGPVVVAHLRCQLASGLTTGALVGGAVSVSHLSLEQEECEIIIFKEPPENGDNEKNSFIMVATFKYGGKYDMEANSKEG
jgi:hypothetical protein